MSNVQVSLSCILFCANGASKVGTKNERDLGGRLSRKNLEVFFFVFGSIEIEGARVNRHVIDSIHSVLTSIGSVHKLGSWAIILDIVNSHSVHLQ